MKRTKDKMWNSNPTGNVETAVSSKKGLSGKKQQNKNGFRNFFLSSMSLVNIPEAWLKGGEEKLEVQTEWQTEMADECVWESEFLEDGLTWSHTFEHV